MGGFERAFSIFDPIAEKSTCHVSTGRKIHTKIDINPRLDFSRYCQNSYHKSLIMFTNLTVAPELQIDYLVK